MTGDFEIDDMLDRHGKAIQRATKIPRVPSPVEQLVRWLFSRSYEEGVRSAKQCVALLLALGLFGTWLLCQISVDNWYCGDAYNESNEIAMREYYWKFFVELRAHARK